MHSLKNIQLLLLTGLLVQIDPGFAHNNDKARDAEAILGRIAKEKALESDWIPSGPTAENIQAATKVDDLAAKGSPEEKLLIALQNGDLKNAETLIVACTTLEARDSLNMTPLMLAAKKGYTDIARKLIVAGANVSAKDRYHWTPLSHALDNNHSEVVTLLLAHGAAKNQKNLGELFVSAVHKGNNEIVKALLAADIDIDSNALETAYMLTRNADMKKAIMDYNNKKMQ